MTHPFNVGKHFRPVIAHAKAMECARGIEMTPNWVRMKCDEKDPEEQFEGV